MGKGFFKYIFVIVVISLGIYTGYKFLKEDSLKAEESLDQTSTVSTIQKELRFAIAEFDTINPLLSNNRNVQEISKIIFEPLVTLNENYKLEYCLATEVVKQDDLTYLIQLREGVKWQDGSNFTANDVKFTIDIIKQGGISTIYSENVKNISELKKVNNYTIELKLSQAVPFFEYNLTFPILSMNYFGEEDFQTTEKNLMPIGTGMFKISTVESDLITLIKNNNYWDSTKSSMAEEVLVKLYPSMGEVYNAFKLGEIDILIVKSNNIEEYIGTLGYNKIEYKAREYDFLAFNTEIYSETAVRKAISLIIEKDSIVASILGSGYVSSNFSLDMGNWLYTQDLTIQPNTEEAKNILIANGWTYKNNSWIKNGEKLTLNISVNANNEARVQVVNAICDNLNHFGIKANVVSLSADNYLNDLNNKNFECILTGIETSFSPSLHTFFGESNLANYNNTEILELIKKIENTTDENLLYDSYRTIYEKYLEEAPYIGLYRNTDIVIYNQGLVGNLSPNTFNLFHNIEKWYRQ